MPASPNRSLDLQELMDHARRSERIARTLFEIEVEVMNLSDSTAFLDHLTDLVLTRFGLDRVWLVLTDIENNQRLCASLSQQGAQVMIHRVPTVDFLRLVGNTRMPALIDQPQRFSQLIPPGIRQHIGSMAALPLIMDDRVVGGLCLGSQDDQRYQPGMESFFLEQLAVKASIGLTSVWAREQLRQLATRDPLTGLRNRRDLDDTMGQELSRSRRYTFPLSILFIDCDDFKQVNDTYGHDCGDAYLCFIGEQLQSLLREDDSVFRFAGDEFVVLLPNQDLASAHRIGQRFTAHFQDLRFDWKGKQLQATFSWGAASSEEGLHSPEKLLRAADQRLYDDKRKRRTEPERAPSARARSTGYDEQL
ncbi:sensor domain-containing diguanylate cyclase [Marinobacter confluentis]|uniref:diguanylate cyclase n=1 Tax=Marinobacter confluentis TaxID=1697557 RepID=A0A4Z1C1R5_9GAMM|nr:sensor domain-containing diguanylate cyclase [Marinobacter confluentis]TGN41178.1 sensor domain-containing diguanylate cyclase [Marinobacter confluentis]